VSKRYSLPPVLEQSDLWSAVTSFWLKRVHEEQETGQAPGTDSGALRRARALAQPVARRAGASAPLGRRAKGVPVRPSLAGGAREHARGGVRQCAGARLEQVLRELHLDDARRAALAGQAVVQHVRAHAKVVGHHRAQRRHRRKCARRDQDVHLRRGAHARTHGPRMRCSGAAPPAFAARCRRTRQHHSGRTGARGARPVQGKQCRGGGGRAPPAA